MCKDAKRVGTRSRLQLRLCERAKKKLLTFDCEYVLLPIHLLRMGSCPLHVQHRLVRDPLTSMRGSHYKLGGTLTKFSGVHEMLTLQEIAAPSGGHSANVSGCTPICCEASAMHGRVLHHQQNNVPDHRLLELAVHRVCCFQACYLL